MFLANGFAVVLMLGSMLPSISEKNNFTNTEVDVYAMSVDVINGKIYYWWDNDNLSRKTAFPSPIDYDISQNIDLPYGALFELLGTTYPNETHNVYIDYNADFKNRNGRINFGYISLPIEYEIDSQIGWSGTSFVHGNNAVPNSGYEGSIYLGDWDTGTINYAYSSYCLSWYCENNTTTTNYANVELNLPYLLRVDTNVTEQSQNNYVRTQNNYYTTTYNSYYIEQTTNLRNEVDYYMDAYSDANATIDNLRWELENGVENVFDWLKNVFNSFAGFLNMEIAPNITIGMLLGIPLVAFALFFILKLTLS